MTRQRIADVRSTYSAERAREEFYGDWASALLYRPISFWLALLLIRISIGATAVTASMIALSLAMPVLAAHGGTAATGAIGCVAFVCMVLDCADGNIARATGTTSEIGAYLDFMGDVVFRIAFYGSIGYVADAALSAPAMLHGYAFAAAALAACVALGARVCRYRQKAVKGHSYYSHHLADDASFVERFVFPLLSGADRITPLLVLAAAAWGGLGWVVVWLLVYSIGDFLYTQVVIIVELRSAR